MRVSMGVLGPYLVGFLAVAVVFYTW
jgi:hypothetical protein